MLSRWRALSRYIDDGRIEMDNSAAERALRTGALGRKNYLFPGSDAGGERAAAAIYSLLGSAKLNGVDTELYLRHALEAKIFTPVIHAGPFREDDRRSGARTSARLSRSPVPSDPTGRGLNVTEPFAKNEKS